MAARDEGAALIEFCLALPLLLVFFLGLWRYSYNRKPGTSFLSIHCGDSFG